MPQTTTQNNNKEGKRMLESLKKGLSVVENKERELNSNKIVNDNQIKQNKDKLMNELFTKMSESGVDLNDLTSINKFLMNLSRQDPDLVELFNFAFGNLVGPEEGEVPPQAVPGRQSAQIPQQNIQKGAKSPINTFDNLRNEIMRK